MDCSLWFGRCRVNSASEITEHFDMASLRGYFLGGSLAEWLREHGGEEQAELVSRLDPHDPQLDSRLAEIFGHSLTAKNEVFTGAASGEISAGGSGYSSGRSVGSYLAGSGTAFYGSYSMALGSFGYGSFSGGSFGGFRLWEWEWEWRFGYRSGSIYGSFRGGSFMGGSFAGGSFWWGSFGGLSGSFSGSFPLWFPGLQTVGGSRYITADEYDRIMYMTLRRCPLDCFGYGIHIV